VPPQEQMSALGRKRTPAKLFQDQISGGKRGPIETARQCLEPT
jgi:hypothetical protein